MAGVLKARDAGGTLRTITAFKVRDVGGTLRTLSFIKVRDAGGTLREVFTAGGGGGGSNPTYITPGSVSFSGKGSTRSSVFNAVSTGGAPTSYTWGLLDGDGYVSAGGSTASATLTVYVSPGDSTFSTFFCDMVIGGITYRATCAFSYSSNL